MHPILGLQEFLLFFINKKKFSMFFEISVVVTHNKP